MGYGGTILLVTILVISAAVLFLAVRGISWAKNARKEGEEERRLVLKSIDDGNRSIAAALISIQADLADMRNQLAVIEARTRDDA